MNDFDKLESCLSDKFVIRIDKTRNEKDLYDEFIVIFINPEKKQPGHVVFRINFADIKGLNQFKKILIDKFDITIKGFKNWKKSIQKGKF